jgi:hypothetical protein
MGKEEGNGGWKGEIREWVERVGKRMGDGEKRGMKGKVVECIRIGPLEGPNPATGLFLIGLLVKIKCNQTAILSFTGLLDGLTNELADPL